MGTAEPAPGEDVQPVEGAPAHGSDPAPDQASPTAEQGERGIVASRDGTKLYFFHCCVSSLPQYRYTTDPTLVTWTTPVVAGDASMRPVSGNNCGNAAAECYRAHTFEFTETATAGNWVYIAKSDSGFGQSGRGTQVGTLGGAWSTQVDHGGSGGLSGGGESRATAFIDRGGAVIDDGVAPDGADDADRYRHRDRQCDRETRERRDNE